MSAQVERLEPTEIQAGNSILLLKTLPDYPATEGWVLTYYLKPQSGADASQLIEPVQATAAGGDFSLDIPGTTTAEYGPGLYWLIGLVALTDDRFEVYRGPLTILPNPAGDESIIAWDGRTYWEKMRDKLRDMISEGAIREVVEYTFNGVHSKVTTLKEAFDALAYAESQVANEKASKAGKQRKILTRFVAAR